MSRLIGRHNSCYVYLDTMGTIKKTIAFWPSKALLKLHVHRPTIHRELQGAFVPLHPPPLSHFPTDRITRRKQRKNSVVALNYIIVWIKQKLIVRQRLNRDRASRCIHTSAPAKRLNEFRSGCLCVSAGMITNIDITSKRSNGRVKNVTYTRSA